MSFSDYAAGLVIALIGWTLREVYSIKATVSAAAVKLDVLWKAHNDADSDRS